MPELRREHSVGRCGRASSLDMAKNGRSRLEPGGCFDIGHKLARDTSQANGIRACFIRRWMTTSPAFGFAPSETHTIENRFPARCRAVSTVQTFSIS